MLFPGQELREFTVYKPDTRETENGRAGMVNGFVIIGTVRAILAVAKPEELQRWRQLNHPVTHTVIMQRAPPFEVLPGYVFETSGRRFHNMTMPDNIGGLGHWTIFHCDERNDVF